ncbi:hypothetical protein ACFQO9_19305 [Chryseobacterium zhengzhouense]|uniref:Uncharacterized protein n=1 Tax=Chryseobacterium zhengzhouense TaxID=1636086 RepID=A0ABW2M229_9FLAO
MRTGKIKLKRKQQLKKLEAMKERRIKKIKKNRARRRIPVRDINDVIDELAYLNEDENILKSIRFLDDMYILDME